MNGTVDVKSDLDRDIPHLIWSVPCLLLSRPHYQRELSARPAAAARLLLSEASRRDGWVGGWMHLLRRSVKPRFLPSDSSGLGWKESLFVGKVA